MKRKYKFKLFLAVVLASVSFGDLCAFNPVSVSTNIVTEEGDNWIEVQNENGIKISFLEFKLKDEMFLKIQFENTTDKAIDFVWSLNSKNEKIVITKDEMEEIKTSLGPLKSAVYGNEMLFQINKEESIIDFSVTIK